MEDYDYTYEVRTEACERGASFADSLSQGNRFSYMGNGFSKREVEGRDLCESFAVEQTAGSDSPRKGWYLEDADKPFLYEY